MVGGEPASISARLLWRIGILERLAGAYKLGRCQQRRVAQAGLLGQNGRFEVPVVAHQVAHDFEEVGERLLPIHKKRGGNVAVANEAERLLDISRSMVESGFAGDLGVVKKGSVETHFALMGPP